MLRPSGVSSYSTRRTGTAYSVRVISPSRSSERSDWVSTFALTPRIGTRSSENRRGPSSRQRITSPAHLSPKRIGDRPDGQSSSNISGSKGFTASG